MILLGIWTSQSKASLNASHLQSDDRIGVNGLKC
jgi:hypothetical protein